MLVKVCGTVALLMLAPATADDSADIATAAMLLERRALFTIKTIINTICCHGVYITHTGPPCAVGMDPARGAASSGELIFELKMRNTPPSHYDNSEPHCTHHESFLFQPACTRSQAARAASAVQHRAAWPYICTHGVLGADQLVAAFCEQCVPWRVPTGREASSCCRHIPFYQ